MPKVYLTEQSRREAQEMKQNEVLVDRMCFLQGKGIKRVMDLAAELNLSKSTITRIKNPSHTGKVDFAIIRRLAHSVGLTADDWLRLGGYE